MGYIEPQMLPSVLCEAVMWGGAVATPGRPYHTEMGNGHFPTGVPFKTGEITGALSISRDHGYENEVHKRFIVTSPEYYGFQVNDDGDHFLYGGPGSPDPN